MAWKIFILVALIMPYLARIPGAITKGADWIWQYLPSLGGVLFFGMFNLLAVLPLVVVGLLSDRFDLRAAFWITAAIFTVATFVLHYGYDLASDAQAAIGLIAIPLIIGVIAAVAGALAIGGELLLRR